MTLVAKNSADLGGPVPELGKFQLSDCLSVGLEPPGNRTVMFYFADFRAALKGSQRKGRDLQRCIPVRWSAGETFSGVEVLMVTSSGGKGLVFPKGGWETDETVEAAAARETVEEAGVRGTIEEPILGAFDFHSSKAERLHSAHKGKCIAYMFVMKVEEELPIWPEKTQRERVWVSLEDACSKCKHEWMRDALKVWMKRQGWEEELPLSCRNVNGNVTSVQCPSSKKITAGM